jgi:AAA family ATP:ADP antiporter
MEKLIKKMVDVRAGEVRAMLWSFAYFFFLLSSYYILRPMRDAMGITGGTRNLPWLFGATFAAMLLAAPLLAAVVSRLPRARFIPIVYGFFAANLVIFWLLLSSGVAPVTVARSFFVWVTIFSVFTVSVFWSFMADLFASEQSKRLFGFIAAGGSIGTLLGPALTATLAKPLGPANLLLIAALLLGLAIVCASRLERCAADVRAAREAAAGSTPGAPAKDARIVGGGMFSGFALLAKSPYMGGIALWVFILSIAGTFLYLPFMDLVGHAYPDPALRTAFLAKIELFIGILSLVVQLLAAGRVISRIGTGFAAALLPLVFVVGFVTLGFNPVVMVGAVFQILQRTVNFGVANVARESLFTVLTREEKFKTKNIIDGALFRGADFINAMIYKAMSSVMALPAVAGVAAVIAGGWLVLSLALGRAQEKKARQIAAEAASAQ